jgi:acetoin utilization deacetylase AcuC-like enzyme
MLIVANPDHARHSGRHEMFRGRLVPCHEVPARLDHVLAELGRRPLGDIRPPPPIEKAQLERVHSRRYLEFLRSAWAEWIALDAGNAEIDALPSIWPVRGFRHDVEPTNFAARLGWFSFDAGTPLTRASISTCRCRPEPASRAGARR